MSTVPSTTIVTNLKDVTAPTANTLAIGTGQADVTCPECWPWR